MGGLATNFTSGGTAFCNSCLSLAVTLVVQEMHPMGNYAPRQDLWIVSGSVPMPHKNTPSRDEDTATGASLARGAGCDDSTAWERLVVAYSPLVYTWSRRSGVKPSDASRVVQEVMRDVGRKIKDFFQDQRGDGFRTWLRRLTQYRIADLCREEGRDAGHLAEHHPNGDANPADILAGLISEDKQQLLAKIQAEFSARNWQIFWSVVVEEREPAEVAEMFGVTLNVARLAKSRVLKRLREKMRLLESRQ